MDFYWCLMWNDQLTIRNMSSFAHYVVTKHCKWVILYQFIDYGGHVIDVHVGNKYNRQLSPLWFPTGLLYAYIHQVWFTIHSHNIPNEFFTWINANTALYIAHWQSYA